MFDLSGQMVEALTSVCFDDPADSAGGGGIQHSKSGELGVVETGLVG
ncbi:MAG: hypothetical protein FWD80_05960 [Propionibacteriaceae bacterium]|nr:hypothetical protein [Propionibacteriaceae bacterium]